MEWGELTGYRWEDGVFPEIRPPKAIFVVIDQSFLHRYRQLFVSHVLLQLVHDRVVFNFGGVQAEKELQEHNWNKAR